MQVESRPMVYYPENLLIRVDVGKMFVIGYKL